MGTSLSPSPHFLSTKLHHCSSPPSNVFSLHVSSTPFINFRIMRQHGLRSLSAAFVEKTLHVSWMISDKDASDDYGGWAVGETQLGEKIKKKDKGILKFLLMGAGVSAVILATAIASSSFTSKGFNLKPGAPSNALKQLLTPSCSLRGLNESPNSSTDSNSVDYETRTESYEVEVQIHAPVVTQLGNGYRFALSEYPEFYLESRAGEHNQQTNEYDPILEKISIKPDSMKTSPEREIITVSTDSTQEEALQLLKKLKIIDDNVKADALCTRREYARWLVKANSSLERNPEHRISMLPSGIVVQAFDDVNIGDPDFQFIQALAEVGIVPGKLLDKNQSSGLDGLKVNEGLNFYPESSISRLDLISWIARLEYSCMPQVREISTKNTGFMDVSMINPEASSEFFFDIFAGDKSIIRKVFGQSRRFQPQKPATRAQAAVALTSGRMGEAIHSELLRLETEYSSMLAEMEEIRSELLLRGEIQGFWEEKFNEVKAYGEEVARRFEAALSELEHEKGVRSKTLGQNLKERTTLDCQRKLLVNLKEEINEMSERLERERADFIVEQKDIEEILSDLQAKQETMVEAKSVLEAEIEALRMLRSWIEDEAKRSQARAQVLERVGRRWKWNDDQA